MDKGICGTILVKIPGKAEFTRKLDQSKDWGPRSERNKRKGFRNQKDPEWGEEVKGNSDREE